MNLHKNLWNFNFSHIYIEKNIKNHHNTINILDKFKNSKKIYIENYKEIFCRANQNFNIQKNTPKIILAEKKDGFIYEGADVCQDFGNEHFYYTSSIMNCIYDCEYCYLQGMYSSANIVIFVNIEDYFNQIHNILDEHKVYLCISYDTDLLALEGVIDFTRQYIDFTRKNENLKIEIRTKSSNFNSIKKLEPCNRIIMAWTLSPEEIRKNFEHKTPCLKNRLEDIKEAQKLGWPVRICFDPLLYIDNWNEIYGKFIETVFSEIDNKKILDCSIGVFRVSKDYFKKMYKQRKLSPILSYPFYCKDGVYSYSKNHEKEITDFIYDKVNNYIDTNKIFML